MLEDIVAGVLSTVISGTGARVVSVAQQWNSRRKSRDAAEVLTWFSDYKLTNRMPLITLPQGAHEEDVAKLLNGYTCQSLLNELRAVRLCDAPETEVAELRKAFTALGPAGGGTEWSAFLDALFDYCNGELRRMVELLSTQQPEVLHDARDAAFNTRIVAELRTISRHTASLENRPDPAAEASFLARYRAHILKQYGTITPPDFDRRHPVPIASLHVTPGINLHVLHDTSRGSDVTELTLDDFTTAIDRTVLLGAPGAGKTTTTGVLLHRFASEPDGLIPFLVTLREFAGTGRSVVEQIEHTMNASYQCPAPAGLVTRLLLDGAAIVAFDGLDELLDPSRRTQIAEVIENFALEYPHVRILVTSRLVGYDQARLDDSQFTCYRIGDFNAEQVTEYAHKWFALQEGLSKPEVAKWSEAFIRESANVPDLRRNPLMLALLCILYRGERSLPRNSVGVYAKCTDLLLRLWDDHRGIHVALTKAHMVEPALRLLADRMLREEGLRAAYPRRRLILDTARYLHERAFDTYEEAEAAARAFVTFCTGRAWVFTEVGLASDGEPLYGFTHRTFMEYFAAYHAAYSHDSPEDLAAALLPTLADKQWQIVADLTVQIKDQLVDRGAERLILALLADDRIQLPDARPSYNTVLDFAARCLSIASVPPKTVREVCRRALDRVLATDRHAKSVRVAAGVPLGTLITRCWEHRLIVREELRTRTSALIMSGDPASRLNGLELAILCDSWFEGLRSSGDQELSAFWWQAAREAIEEHSTLVLEAARHNDVIMRRAFDVGLVKVTDVIGETSESIGRLFNRCRTSSLTSGYSLPLALELLMMLVFRPEHDTSHRLHDTYADLERQLAEHWPTPPWLSSDEPGAYDIIKVVISGRLIPVDSSVASVAACLLPFIEHQIDRSTAESDLHWVNDGLRILGPFVHARVTRKPPPQFPTLPVPERIQSEIESWARHEFDFVEHDQQRERPLFR